MQVKYLCIEALGWQLVPAPPWPTRARLGTTIQLIELGSGFSFKRPIDKRAGFGPVYLSPSPRISSVTHYMNVKE